MNLWKRLFSRFTIRGQALAKVTKGRKCAEKGESSNAIKYYTDVVGTSESPRDVIAMAIFNRALVYAAIGKLNQATEDLNTILGMPEAIPRIKKSATDKLVRMQRKLERESPTTEA